MVTGSTRSIYKIRKLFNLYVTIDDPTILPLPKNPKLAISDPNWKSGMQYEFNALIKKNMRGLISRPYDVNIICCMWILFHKKKSNGYYETFRPVVKPVTIHTVVTIALSKLWHIHQLDIHYVFLHGDLHETIYMHQTLGFRDPHFPDYVCRLQKSLYGLKQAPHVWYKLFADYVTAIEFWHNTSDRSLFIYHRGSDMAYILLYVYDIILFTSSHDLHKSIMVLLASDFSMKDLSPMSYFFWVL